MYFRFLLTSQRCTGKVRSVVTDGVTLGHPCCVGALNYENPLPNNQAIYCDDHNHKKNECAVVLCKERVEPGYKTCNNVDHRTCEDYYAKMGKGMFQIKTRLERNKRSQTSSVMSNETTEHSGTDHITIRSEDSIEETLQ